MKSALYKDIWREIRRTKNRFLSIFAIVALGTGFFAGIKSTCPDMLLTADQYFAVQQLMDVKILSTYGFDEKDVAAVRESGQAHGFYAGYSADLFLKTAGQPDVIAKVYSLPRQREGKDFLNQPVLLEGRMPEAPGECLVENNMPMDYAFSLGQTVTLASGDPEEPVSDRLDRDTYTVVGIARSPLYLNFERGSASIGNGAADCFVLIPEENFNLEVYTDLYLTLEGAQGLSAFSQEYKDLVKEQMDSLEELADRREDERFQEILEEAYGELNDAKEELRDGEETQRRELADAQAELEDAWQKILDGRTELEDGRREFEEEIAEAQEEIAKAEEELADGESEYLAGYREYRENRPDAIQELIDGHEQIKQAEVDIRNNTYTLEQTEQTLIAARTQLEMGKGELAQKEEELQAAQTLVSGALGAATGQIPPEALTPELVAQLSAGLWELDENLGLLFDEAMAGNQEASAQLVPLLLGQQQALLEAGAALEQAKQTLAQQEQELIAGEKALADGKVQLSQGVLALEKAKRDWEDGKEELLEAQKELSRARKRLDRGYKALDEAVAELEEEKAKGLQELADAEQELLDGEREYNDGVAEYWQAKRDSDAELADARQKIADAEKEIAGLKAPEWYVFDRSVNPGYSSYEDDAQRVDAIAKVFPVFFLLVAALVCLTTMTRMVEEQRTQIGTLKALGYSEGAIMLKFLVYAAAASLLGSALGLGVGFQLFPRVIYAAYGISYVTPPLIAPFRADYAVWVTLAALACTLSAAFFACRQELRSQPSQLMRPKAPKSGKRVLLERIPPLWDRLSFLQKVTVRNLFRYKKRIVMTVLGISGCTALMLTGFGLKESISTIVLKQFDDIFTYDALVVVDDTSSREELLAVEESLGESPQILGWMPVRQQTMDAGGEGRWQQVYLFVPQSVEEMGEYVSLRTRGEETPVPLTDEGAVITEKFAKLAGLSVGDGLSLRDSDNQMVEVPVTGITENYAMHYVYLSPRAYERLYGGPPVYNAYTLQLAQLDKEGKNQLSTQLTAWDPVLAVSYSQDSKDNFSDVISSLNYVVLVLIFCSGALAFVVLYNLTNINITERIREIATIKVLGFYDQEVSAYVYRENLILTVLGALAGLGLGILLHGFVIQTAEIDTVMFGRVISLPSYLLSFALTMAFAALVNFLMYFKLKTISMVESLKSIE